MHQVWYTKVHAIILHHASRIRVICSFRELVLLWTTISHTYPWICPFLITRTHLIPAQALETLLAGGRAIGIGGPKSAVTVEWNDGGAVGHNEHQEGVTYV